MAKQITPPDDGEMDSLYSDNAEASPPKEGATSIDQENADDQTALVPTKLLQPDDGKPLKVGDEIVVQIAAIHGDEAEIKYAPKKEKSADEGMSSDEELESLGKQY